MNTVKFTTRYSDYRRTGKMCDDMLLRVKDQFEYHFVREEVLHGSLPMRGGIISRKDLALQQDMEKLLLIPVSKQATMVRPRHLPKFGRRSCLDTVFEIGEDV